MIPVHHDGGEQSYLAPNVTAFRVMAYDEIDCEAMKGHPDRKLGSVVSKRKERAAIIGLWAVMASVMIVLLQWSPWHRKQLGGGALEELYHDLPSKSLAPSRLKKHVEENSGNEFWIEKLLNEPRVFILHNLISQEEVDQLIAAGERKGMSEALITPYGSNDLVPSSTRTNTAAWLEDALVSKIEHKIAEVTGTHPEDGENLQILHYANGNQYFQEHRDYFDPKEDPPANFEKGGNRMVTVITYLKTPETGGETYFTKLDVKLKCRPGDAIVFWNLKPDGSVDPDTYHSALSPQEGQKWVAVKWIHERRYQALDAAQGATQRGHYARKKLALQYARVSVAAR